MSIVSRLESIMEGAAIWGSFYRANPDKFAEDYLHIQLRLFQRILLTMMFWSTTFVLIACRGLGKTYISAIYCVVRCILYPGTKICIASGTRGQAINVLEKILLELKPQSEELRAEIDDKQSKINGTNAQIVFFNTSVIKVVTASDSARGNRCNVLLLDEYRLISKDTIDTVLKKFLTLRRMPKYQELSDAEKKREYAKEKNLTMYLSSAYFKDHWSYTKCLDTFEVMKDERRRQFVCGFPYELSIEEGLLDPETVADDMSESDFSEVKWSMEMDALFFGSEDGAFFDFSNISKNRTIKYPMLPDEIASKLSNNPFIRIQEKHNGEIRILSADIALMSSRKNNNDATAVFINQMKPSTAGRYSNNIIYTDTYEGMRTDEQALTIRKLYEEYKCDYIVLDTNGLGLGVYDALSRDMVDPDTGELYPALSCCNNPEMASRCTTIGAQKVIWSIKASAQFNSDCAFMLREAFKSGRIRLLATEYDAEKYLSALKGYPSLSDSDKMKMQLPYIHTTLLIDELTKLQYEEAGGRVKLTERSGMRKDRYSSLSYNYYVAMQLENKMCKRQSMSFDTTDNFIIKAPKSFNKNKYGKAVNALHGKPKFW